MELTVGPVLFEWKREELLSFYEELTHLDVDRVYLGEVICVKKRALTLKDIEHIARRLERSGKKVVLTTLAVVSNEEELQLVRDITSLPWAVEANDMSVFNMLDPQKREVLAGPHITTYNVKDIECLKDLGVERVTFPVELPRDSIRYNIEKTGITAEVFAHGKVPLSFSWRCYTSRAFGLTKERCRHDCLRYPDGMEVRTMKDEPLFTVNGTSILSALTYTLVEFIEDLKEIGVSALRISPVYRETPRVIEIFRKRLEGLMGPEEALEAIRSITPAGICNGWYMGGAGKDYIGYKVLARS